jgi:hypothetical protein
MFLKIYAFLEGYGGYFDICRGIRSAFGGRWRGSSPQHVALVHKVRRS